VIYTCEETTCEPEAQKNNLHVHVQHIHLLIRLRINTMNTTKTEDGKKKV
jgi:hypothetical protein